MSLRSVIVCAFFLIAFCAQSPSSFSQEIASDSSSTVDSISAYHKWTQAEKKELRYQSPTAALLKSAIVPGLGQLGNRKYLKAGIVIALEGTLFLRWRKFRNRTVEARELFEAQSIEDNLELRGEYFNKFIDVRNDRNLFAWLTGTAVFLSMLDAFVDAHLVGFPEIDDSDNPGEPASGSSVSLNVSPFGSNGIEAQPTLFLRFQF